MSKVCRLTQYQSLTIFNKTDSAPGEYLRTMTYEGNSLLGTLLIERLDSGSVDVEFYEILDHTEHLRESFSFGSVDAHDLVVLPFHTKMRVKITTTDTASFLLKMTCRNDQIDIAPNASIIGEAFYQDGVEVSTPETQQTLTSFVVPPGKTRYLSTIKVSCFRAGTWIAELDSVIIGSGRTAAGQPDSSITYAPFRKLASTSSFVLKFRALSGKASDVHYHVMSNDI